MRVSAYAPVRLMAAPAVLWSEAEYLAGMCIRQLGVQGGEKKRNEILQLAVLEVMLALS